MPHRLLLADDSVTIQRVIELTFADEDIQVTAVGDGQQAIDRIAAEPPDIVLADVGMPERDGYEVAAFIKDRPELSHIPVLLLTGAFEPVDEARARQVRCDGVLAKPFEPQLLITRVKDLLGRAPSGSAVPDSLDLRPAAPPPSPDDDLALDPRQMLEGAPPHSEEAETSLDDYFDRLDQAFANLAGTAAAAREASPATRGLPAWGLPAPAPSAPAVTPVRSAASYVELPVADAFAALLGAESAGETRTERGAPAALLLPAPEPAGADLDAIAERVIERLGLGHGQVAALVSEIAERLVREEIERLKAAAR